MKAMILAAGRGERLRPLTDTTPKPLIKVAGKSLIEYHLEKLADSGFKEVIINTAWLAEKIHQSLGDGSRFNLCIRYSDEGEALETAGGIINALELLGDNPFLVINGDIWTDYDFKQIPALHDNSEAHVVLVNNPEHNPGGDFTITDGKLGNMGQDRYTFSGIAVYSPAFFSGCQKGISPLAPLLKQKAENNLVSAEYYTGYWTDVGSIERLQQLENKPGGL